MAKIDEFRIDDLTRRLERLLKVWATICFEPIEEIPEERLADVRAEAREAAVAEVKHFIGGFRCTDTEFAIWASDVVDAFGEEEFPMYCRRPPRISPDAAHKYLVVKLTGVENSVQAGLRVILWGAAVRKPSLLLGEVQWWQESDFRWDVQEWASMMVISEGAGYMADPDVMQWVKRGFDSLVKSFQSRASADEVPRGSGSGENAQDMANSGEETPRVRHTQAEVDEKLEKYQREHKSKFDELARRLASGDTTAKKEAQELFGRNRMVAKLKLNEGMVSKTPAWKEIKAALFPEETAPNPVRPKRQGIEPTVARASEAAGDLVLLSVEKQEMLKEIDVVIEKANDSDREVYQALRTEVETGRKSPEQASDLLALYQEQSADSRAKHVARDAGLVK